MESGNSSSREKMSGSVIVTVSAIGEINTAKRRLVLEISNETNKQVSGIAPTTQKLECELAPNQHSAQWNRSFHYNTREMVDDNITFTLRAHEQRDKDEYLAKNIIQSLALSSGPIKLPLLDSKSQEVAVITVTVEFIDQQDIVGGIRATDLSLSPGEGYQPRYNAVDLYRPPPIVSSGQVKPEQKYNCFNFFDGDQIPGFDQIDFFPAKFKEVTRKDKTRAGIFNFDP